METLPTTVTFVVRLSHAAGADWIGVVERVGTGEKRRCHGLHEIGTLIGRMARPPGGTGANEPQTKEDPGHDDVDA